MALKQGVSQRRAYLPYSHPPLHVLFGGHNREYLVDDFTREAKKRNSVRIELHEMVCCKGVQAVQAFEKNASKSVATAAPGALGRYELSKVR